MVFNFSVDVEKNFVLTDRINEQIESKANEFVFFSSLM